MESEAIANLSNLLDEDFFVAVEKQNFEYSLNESPPPLNIQTVLSLKQVYLL